MRPGAVSKHARATGRLSRMRDRRDSACALFLLALSWVACSSNGSAGTDASSDAAVSLDDAGAVGDGSVEADGSTETDARSISSLDALLDALRMDTNAALLSQANAGGWPALVENGYLFVTSDPALDRVAGDHDAWAGTAMQDDSGFRWVVLDVTAGSRYKFTNLTDWIGDPWSRAYEWDEFGLMSLVPPQNAHLERYFAQSADGLAARTVRVWVPAEPLTHVLYMHDGQNLFNPNAIGGGWRLQDSAPAGMLIVGIDNTAARMDEYTHVTDEIDGFGAEIGGHGDQYAAFVQGDIRALIQSHYGEPERVGVMGSSLGGLISFHIADRYPGEYDFAASLSGTMGWGSIEPGRMNQTMIEVYETAGHRGTALYLDSGGSGTCVDADSDGIYDDDPDARDNYCENVQLRDVLYSAGYVDGTDVWHWWEPNAQHNEAAWSARVWRPLQAFAGI